MISEGGKALPPMQRDQYGIKQPWVPTYLCDHPIGPAPLAFPLPDLAQKQKGAVGRRDQPILAQATGANKPAGDHCCHRLLTHKDLLPLTALQA